MSFIAQPDRLRVGTVTDKSAIDLTLEFIAHQRPGSLAESAWSTWLTRIRRDLASSPVGPVQRVIYEVGHRVLDEDPRRPYETLAAAIGRRNIATGCADFKALAIRPDLEWASVRLVMSMLLDKITADCLADEFRTLEINCSRNSPACELLISIPEFRIARQCAGESGMSQEFCFRKSLPPLFNGDPKDWFGWCDWFFSELLQTAPQLTCENENHRVYEWSILPDLDLVREKIPNLRWPVRAVALKDGSRDSLPRAASFILLSQTPIIPAPRNAVPVTLDQLLGIQQSLYVCERVSLSLLKDDTSDQVLQHVFRLRFESPAREPSAALLVDITRQNFDALVHAYVRLSADRHTPYVVYFMRSPTGKNVHVGDDIFFYVWDIRPYGQVRGRARIQSILESDSESSFQVGDEERSAFPSFEAAAVFLRQKRRALRLELTELQLASDDGTPIDYKVLCCDVLKFPVKWDDHSRAVLLQLFPNEDVGHTYLDAEQARALSDEFAFTAAEQMHIEVQDWPPAVQHYLEEQKVWIQHTAGRFSDYRSSPESQITTATVRNALASAGLVQGRRGMDALRWTIGKVDYWDTKRIQQGFEGVLSRFQESHDIRNIVLCPLGGVVDSGPSLSRILERVRDFLELG